MATIVRMNVVPKHRVKQLIGWGQLIGWMVRPRLRVDGVGSNRRWLCWQLAPSSLSCRSVICGRRGLSRERVVILIVL
jgi:hypothetical protein